MLPTYVTVMHSNNPYFPVQDEEYPFKLFEERALLAANNTPFKSIIMPEDFTICSILFADKTRMTIGQMALMEDGDYGIMDYLSNYWVKQEELEATSDNPKDEDAMDKIDSIFMKFDWAVH
jgi:hypothetical protein